MMPLQKRRPSLDRAATEPVPELTHQPSLESVRSPITPSHDASVHPTDKTLQADTTHKDPKTNSYPFPNPTATDTSAPVVQVTASDTKDTPNVPSKDLPFLSKDPFAAPEDDDIIPFDKNKAIVPSRHGSVRSIMSTSSMQSLKRGLGSIKRSLSRSRSKSRARRAERKLKEKTDAEGLMVPGGELGPPGRAGTFMMSNPRRVDTFQVSAMAF